MTNDRYDSLSYLNKTRGLTDFLVDFAVFSVIISIFAIEKT